MDTKYYFLCFINKLKISSSGVRTQIQFAARGKKCVSEQTLLISSHVSALMEVSCKIVGAKAVSHIRMC
jgi:hypothetical protein